MSYSVELITPEEKDSLYQSYESRFLYTNKAEIYGCCMKLLTEIERALRQLLHDERKHKVPWKTHCA